MASRQTVVPPAYPQQVSVMPGSSISWASGPQNHPKAKVAVLGSSGSSGQILPAFSGMLRRKGKSANRGGVRRTSAARESGGWARLEHGPVLDQLARRLSEPEPEPCRRLDHCCNHGHEHGLVEASRECVECVECVECGECTKGWVAGVRVGRGHHGDVLRRVHGGREAGGADAKRYDGAAPHARQHRPDRKDSWWINHA